jgi:hypothetical protein
MREQRGAAGRVAEEFFHERRAAGETGLFGQDPQRAGADDQVDAGDAWVGVKRAQHFDGEDGTTGAGDRQRKDALLGQSDGGDGLELRLVERG